jgi:hypothetical protein
MLDTSTARKTRRICLLGLGFALGACSGSQSGGGLIDRGVCDVLIECASSLAPDARDEYVALYGEGGSCWGVDPQRWATCRESCRQALDAVNLAAELTGQSPSPRPAWAHGRHRAHDRRCPDNSSSSPPDRRGTIRRDGLVVAGRGVRSPVEGFGPPISASSGRSGLSREPSTRNMTVAEFAPIKIGRLHVLYADDPR